jgi:hypothetical protein
LPKEPLVISSKHLKLNYKTIKIGPTGPILIHNTKLEKKLKMR